MPSTYSKGLNYEQAVCDYLITHGYVVRETRWKVSNSIEIDIIAQAGNIIAFIEVKGRNIDGEPPGDPLDAIDKKKRQRMVRGADIYLSCLSETYDYRFDVCSVLYSEALRKVVQLEYIEDAFMPEANNGR